MAYVEAALRRRQIVTAARSVLAREGVSRATVRAVAAEAGVPLGTMQYVFRSKEELLRAVIEDVVGEISEVLKESAELDDGLEHAIRQGMRGFWSKLVSSRPNLQLMQYELTTYALRAVGHQSLARWQYQRYCSIVAEWCQEAANNASETCAVSFAQLGRVIVAGVDGLILQHVCDPNDARSLEDLDTMIDMVISVVNPPK